MNTIMVIFVKYYMDKDYFIKNKKFIQKLLRKPAFEIAVIKFEKGISELEIAREQNISYFMVRKILSGVCENIRKPKKHI